MDKVSSSASTNASTIAGTSASPLPPGVLLTPLKQIAHAKGDIYHALTANAPGFHGFGEAYFTHILNGETKGWKQHKRMVLNLVVPQGAVRFHLHDETTGQTSLVLLGEATPHYARLTVPPGIWLAFSGVGADHSSKDNNNSSSKDNHGSSLILNLASILHDPAEANNAELDRWPLACHLSGTGDVPPEQT